MKIQHISSILDDCDTIRIQWGDDQDIPFEGWVDMKVKIGQNDRSTEKWQINTENKKNHLKIQSN